MKGSRAKKMRRGEKGGGGGKGAVTDRGASSKPSGLEQGSGGRPLGSASASTISYHSGLAEWASPLHVLTSFIYLSGFPGSSANKESACNVGDLGLIPGLGRSPGEGEGYPLQYSGLENSTESIYLFIYC